MRTTAYLIAACALAATLALAGCNRNEPPKPKTDVTPDTPSTGPAHTSGGLSGDPAGGTPAGAATGSPPHAPGEGAADAKTDQGGLSDRPTGAPAKQ
jgi:hypothetical protein